MEKSVPNSRSTHALPGSCGHHFPESASAVAGCSGCSDEALFTVKAISKEAIEFFPERTHAGQTVRMAAMSARRCERSARRRAPRRRSPKEH